GERVQVPLVDHRAARRPQELAKRGPPRDRVGPVRHHDARRTHAAARHHRPCRIDARVISRTYEHRSAEVTESAGGPPPRRTRSGHEVVEQNRASRSSPAGSLTGTRIPALIAAGRTWYPSGAMHALPASRALDPLPPP